MTLASRSWIRSFLAGVLVTGGLALLARGAQPETSETAKPGPAAFHFVQPEPINFDDHAGLDPDLRRQDSQRLGRRPTEVWHVENGAIVGVSNTGAPLGHHEHHLARGRARQTSYLKLEMKLEGDGANAGVQYRGYHVDPKLNSSPFSWGIT